MHALRTRIAQRQRKEDTRRKIFLHTMVHPRNGERLNAWIRRQRPGFIPERDQHRFDATDLYIDSNGPDNTGISIGERLR